MFGAKIAIKKILHRTNIRCPVLSGTYVTKIFFTQYILQNKTGLSGVSAGLSPDLDTDDRPQKKSKKERSLYLFLDAVFSCLLGKWEEELAWGIWGMGVYCNCSIP